MSWVLHKPSRGGVVGSPQPVDVTAGSTITAGQLLVRAGDDNCYDPAGDNAVVVSGVAQHGAAAAATVEMMPIYPGARFKAPYTGTYSGVGQLGGAVGIDASQNVDLDNTTNDLVILDEILTGDDAGYCVVHFISSTLTEMGAEV